MKLFLIKLLTFLLINYCSVNCLTCINGVCDGDDGGVFDLLNGFGFGGGGRQRNERRIDIQVPLEQIYNGAVIPINIHKQIVCPHCRGSGAERPEDIQKCPHCKGQGVQIKKQQIAPGYFQQYQTQCSNCGGQGKIVKSKCHICQGNKQIGKSEVVQVDIPKGIPQGHNIRINGGGDLGQQDLVFLVYQLPHPLFQRDNQDLRIKVKISLKEALLGFEKQITHLDGRKITLKRDEVTQPGEIQTIRDEGMPYQNNPRRKGNLFVEYVVVIPKTFTDDQLDLWESFFYNNQNNN